MLVVNTAHQSRSGWQHLIDEDENGLLGTELDSLANNIDELADSQVCGDEVLLLVDGCDVGFLDFLADDLEGMLVLSWNRWEGDGWLTGIRSAYFCRMRSASALRFSSLCSSLNLERMLAVVSVVVV